MMCSIFVIHPSCVPQFLGCRHHTALDLAVAHGHLALWTDFPQDHAVLNLAPRKLDATSRLHGRIAFGAPTRPLYWQLATPSASYSVWLYLHAFTKDTLFRVQNDFATGGAKWGRKDKANA
jgi:hypothetical protein